MKKQQVFYIHGGHTYFSYDEFWQDLNEHNIQDIYGLPRKKWQDTLRSELGNSFEVFTPTMPNKQNAKYEEWKIWFERHLQYLHDGVILIGLSLGGIFLAKYLSENEFSVQIKQLFLMAAPFELVELKGRKFETSFDFPKEGLQNLAKNVKNIAILQSKDDFVVPYEHALKYKKALPEAELMSFEDKNHFLVEEFPELLEKIRTIT